MVMDKAGECFTKIDFKLEITDNVFLALSRCFNPLTVRVVRDNHSRLLLYAVIESFLARNNTCIRCANLS